MLSFVDRAFTELLKALLSTTCIVKSLGGVKAYASIVWGCLVCRLALRQLCTAFWPICLFRVVFSLFRARLSSVVLVYCF